MRSSIGRIPDALAARCEELAGLNKAPQPIEETISEKTFQLTLIGLAERNGWDWHHITVARKAKPDFPDLILVRHRVVVAELKVEPNKPTAGQLKWIDAFRAAGVAAFVWYPRDWQAIVAILTEKPS